MGRAEERTHLLIGILTMPLIAPLKEWPTPLQMAQGFLETLRPIESSPKWLPPDIYRELLAKYGKHATHWAEAITAPDEVERARALAAWMSQKWRVAFRAVYIPEG